MTPPERLVPLEVAACGREQAAWAVGLRFCLPARLLEISGLARHLDCQGRLRIPSDMPPIPPGEAARLRALRAFTPRGPLSSRLPISYRRVPDCLRSGYASLLGRLQRRRAHRWAEFPRWPLDLSSDLLADLSGSAIAPQVSAPPASAPTPVILSHDLDSAAGLKNLVASFLAIEESVGARSTNFVVPCAWPLDFALLDELRDRGHEIGIHGYDHSNRTPFVSPAERKHRLDAAIPLAARYDARGYRAPSLCRTRPLLADLAGRYAYDGSIPTSGGLFPAANNGCASARPFSLAGLAELPLSLPRDGSLRFLGYAPREIERLWIHLAETIARSGGVVVLLTHCEERFSGNPAMLAAYRNFVQYIAESDRFQWSTPQQVLHDRLPAAPGAPAASVTALAN
ncbi:MAG TPA: hypothetical protein VIK18_21340 [Pirellulales bacterium]